MRIHKINRVSGVSFGHWMALLCIMMFEFFLWETASFAQTAQFPAKEETTLHRKLVANGFDEASLQRFTQRMREAQFTNDTTLQSQQILLEAVTQKLPTAPLLNKAMEGMSKNVSQQAVIRAMEATRDRYAFAYSTAGKMVSEPEKKAQLGNVIADCINAGIQKENISRIENELQQQISYKNLENSIKTQTAIETFTTLRTVARLGVADTDSTRVVSNAIQHRYSIREMEVLSQQFEKQSANRKPADVAASFSHDIENGQRGGDLGSSNAQRSDNAGSGRGNSDPGGGNSGESGGSGNSDAGSGGGNGSSGGNSGGSSGGSSGGGSGSSGGSGGSGGSSGGGSGGGSGGSGGSGGGRK